MTNAVEDRFQIATDGHRSIDTLAASLLVNKVNKQTDPRVCALTLYYTSSTGENHQPSDLAEHMSTRQQVRAL